MRTTSFVALAALVASASLACSVAATGPAPGASPEAPSSSPSETPDAAAGTPDAAPGASASPGSVIPSGVVVLATIPTGVQCVVASVTGAATETVTAAVVAGASSATLNFGALSPGTISVTANAFNTACPGSGAATWTAEPVQATVVEGVATQIQLTLRPAAQASTGGATFSLPAIALATGPRTSYAVLSDGTVRAWGANEAGEFGSTTLASSTTPVVVPGVTNATQIAAGTNFACVTRTDQTVVCWGYQSGAIVASPAIPENTITPAVVSPGLSATKISALGGNVVVIGGGTTHTVGDIGAPPLCLSGTCVPGIAWSPNGVGPSISVAAGGSPSGNPLLVDFCSVSQEGTTTCNWLIGLLTATTAVFAGADYSGGATGNFACSILDTGGVACWGANANGELGIGSTAPQSTPVIVTNLHSVTSMALSRGSTAFTSAHACAVSGGAVLCTGANGDGQLGNETSQSSLTFAAVTGLGSTPIVTIAAGQAHNCALDVQGTVHCWGDNDDGELGDGTTTTRFAPVTVQPW